MFVNAQLAGFSESGSYSPKPGKNTVIDGKLGFNYNKKFGRSHHYGLQRRYQGQSTESNSTTIQVSGLPNDYLNQLGMANGYGLTNTKPGADQQYYPRAFLLMQARQLQITLDRYTAEITANASGSS